MSRVVINDFSDDWLERCEMVKTQGYRILMEVPKNWSIKMGTPFIKRGFAFPGIGGKMYLAVEDAKFAPGEIAYMKGGKNCDEF